MRMSAHQMERKSHQTNFEIPDANSTISGLRIASELCETHKPSRSWSALEASIVDHVFNVLISGQTRLRGS